MSKIAIVGTGYVGLVVGTLLSDFGHNVICVDADKEKIVRLNQGEIPIFEPGLEPIVAANMSYERLSFSTDVERAVKDNDIVFIAVGTPAKEDSSADLEYVLSVARTIGENLNRYKVIVDKSTVPVGTGRLVKRIIESVLQERNVQYEFDVVSNPEFLREGSAVYDFQHPDRVVIGSESERALTAMKEVYRVLYVNETPFIETNLETAEMIKYASNAFLAMKIAYINEIANLCELVGADVQHVAKAMGRDGRIGPKFLHAGAGFGGSCFPKDTRALGMIGREHGIPISLVEATVKANEEHKGRMANKIINAMGDINGKTIAVLGITFKPNTDDMREAPSLVILPRLVQSGARLRVFDPEGKKEGKWRLDEISGSIIFCDNEYQAIEGADAIVLITEWNVFRNLDFERIKTLTNGRYFFDLRNVYDRRDIEEKGFKYWGVGV